MNTQILKNSPFLQILTVLVIAIIVYLFYRIYISLKSSPYVIYFFPIEYSIINPLRYTGLYKSGSRLSGNGADFPNARYPPRGSRIPNIQISRNENGGMEFSYMFWLYVNNYVNTNVIGNRENTYDVNDIRHYTNIFVKGKEDGAVRCPAVGLKPNDNAMVIQMNTYEDPNFKMEITNLPVQKWFAVAIVVKGKRCDVYINGDLKRSITFDSVVKQNNLPVYFGVNGGFNGEFTSGSYHRYAVEADEIRQMVSNGPNMKAYSQTETQAPPYYRKNWWIEHN
jgi:hypothetical protein